MINKKAKIVNEAAHRFQFLSEYTYIGQDDTLQEDDDVEGEEDQLPLMGDQDGKEEGTEEQLPNTPNEPMVGGNDGEGVKGLSDEPKDSDDPTSGSDVPEEDFTEVEEGEEEEVVFDIDDLTAAQDEIKDNLDSFKGDTDTKFDTLLKVTNNLMGLINISQEKLSDFKQEFEKRNPTPLEKLDAQAAISYPFNEKPADFWKSKEQNSNYRIGDDEKKEEEEYVISQSDVDAIGDWGGISKTMSSNISNLKDILNF